MKLLFFSLFISLNCALIGQPKLKKKSTTDPETGITERFYVLKSDNKVKHGSYQKFLLNTKVSSGEYNNGIKQKFIFYKRGNENMLVFDYSKDSVIEYSEPEFSKVVYSNLKQKMEVDRPPLPLFGELELRYFIGRNIRYPSNATEKDKIGMVQVAVKIYKDGKMGLMGIFKGVNKILDNVAENAVSLFTLKDELIWLPAIKDGKKIDSIIIITINFNQALEPKC